MQIVVFDTETTGLLLPDNSDLTMQPKIIEFYGVKLDEDFNIIDEFNQMLDPGEPLSDVIVNITGIKDNMLKGKPAYGEVSAKLQEFFRDTDLSVAHNHGFDSGMMDVESKRVQHETPASRHQLCTVEATMGLTGHRLSLTRLHWMLLQQQFKAHRAKDDVYALVRCFHNLTESGVVKLDEYNPDRV